jgi:hypothetical protein
MYATTYIDGVRHESAKENIWIQKRGSNRSSDKLGNKELHILYTSSYMTRTIKSRRIRSMGHLARMGK